MKETHDTNSRLTLVKIAGSSIPAQKNNQTNLCQDLLTIENTDTDFESARAALCKRATRTCLSKTFANSPNKQKQ